MKTTNLDIQNFHTSKATHKDFHVYNRASDPGKYTITGRWNSGLRQDGLLGPPKLWGLNVEVEIYTNPTEFGNYMVKSKFEGYELISFEIGIDNKLLFVFF